MSPRLYLVGGFPILTPDAKLFIAIIAARPDDGRLIGSRADIKSLAYSTLSNSVT